MRNKYCPKCKKRTLAIYSYRCQHCGFNGRYRLTDFTPEMKNMNEYIEDIKNGLFELQQEVAALKKEIAAINEHLRATQYIRKM